MKPPLVFDAGQDLVFRKLVPWITVLTASVDEEKLLLGIEAGEVADRMRACAKTLAESGVRWTLVKGGRLEERAVDFLRDSKQEKEWVYEHSWMETRNARGKGSTLSAALAVQLAKGFPGSYFPYCWPLNLLITLDQLLSSRRCSTRDGLRFSCTWSSRSAGKRRRSYTSLFQCYA